MQSGGIDAAVERVSRASRRRARAVTEHNRRLSPRSQPVHNDVPPARGRTARWGRPAHRSAIPLATHHPEVLAALGRAGRPQRSEHSSKTPRGEVPSRRTRRPVSPSRSARGRCRSRSRRATLQRFLDDLDGSDPVDLRDRALLEVLYGTGLRVSELAAMTTADVDGATFVRVRGKGDKERAVPLGDQARQATERYVDRGRPALVGPDSGDALWLGVRGGRLEPERHPSRRPRSARHLPARTPSFVRHTPPRRGRRPAECPGFARTLGTGDDSDIHCGHSGTSEKHL